MNIHEIKSLSAFFFLVESGSAFQGSDPEHNFNSGLRRWEHSVGVMHLAGEFISVLRHPDRNQVLRTLRPGCLVPFYVATRYIKNWTRSIGRLHDVFRLK